MSQMTTGMLSGGVNPQASQSLTNAGQFAQQNLSRQESARQANMGNATQRAGLAENARQFDASSQQQESQFQQSQGLQRQQMAQQQGQFDAGMARRQQEMAQNQAFEKEMNQRLFAQQKEMETLRQTIMSLPALERAKRMTEYQAKQKEMMEAQAKAGAAKIELSLAASKSSEASAKAQDIVRSRAELLTRQEAESASAAKNAVQRAMQRLANLKGTLGDDAVETETYSDRYWAGAWGLGTEGTPVNEDFGLKTGRPEGLIDKFKAGMGTGANLFGLLDDPDSATVVLKGDKSALLAKGRRVMAEEFANSLAEIPGLASARDAKSVDAISQIMEELATSQASMAAGTPRPPNSELIRAAVATLEQRGVPMTTVMAGLEAMSDLAAEQRTGMMKSRLMAQANPYGLAEPVSENVRNAYMSELYDSMTGLGIAAHGVVPAERASTWNELHNHLKGPITPEQMREQEILRFLESRDISVDNDAMRGRAIEDLRGTGLFDSVERLLRATDENVQMGPNLEQAGFRYSQDMDNLDAQVEADTAQRILDLLKNGVP